MTRFILELLAALVASGVTFLSLYALTRYLRWRTKSLERSRKALERYEQLIAKLLDDPATPESARELLLQYDLGVMNHTTARYIAHGLSQRRSDWLNGGEDQRDPQGFTDMRALEAYRPDLYDAFVKTIAAGFIATMLRWPFPAFALRFILVDPKRDPVTPARAVAGARGCTLSHAV